MQAHIVLAHPEPQSFNAHLARVARRALEARGWSVSLSDLYAMGLDPFNRMGEWGADGRIKPGAAIHSPFIRRKQRLVLE